MKASITDYIDSVVAGGDEERLLGLAERHVRHPVGVLNVRADAALVAGPLPGLAPRPRTLGVDRGALHQPARHGALLPAQADGLGVRGAEVPAAHRAVRAARDEGVRRQQL